jgi:mRNA N6-methyladenine demethylase
MGRRNKSKDNNSNPTHQRSFQKAPKPFPKKHPHESTMSTIIADDATTPTPPQHNNIMKKKKPVRLPLPFPAHLPVPRNDFLRDTVPEYQESFQAARNTSYLGFHTDGPEHFDQSAIDHALQVLYDHGLFRTDVTQPFGLGTPCAKTYVTRCLVGERGNTYRYLGLRMFAHPWTTSTNTNVQKALQTIRTLNTTLMQRTQEHLRHLPYPAQGRHDLDIALINRMQESSHGTKLKPEPSMGVGRCAVSWHADSSLEHYSTIAVYHTLISPPSTTTAASKPKSSNNNNNTKDILSQWSVALRVAHHAEGPDIPQRHGGLTEGVVQHSIPPLAISLPSGHAYYLLDDFNHHHQHAVLAEGNTTLIRYSSTHRLLRSSHNVSHILDRARTLCRQFHKKGPKPWRVEQLCLTEVESEWVRQFYTQGQEHHDLLWHAWKEDIQALLQCWSQLELRTKQTIEFLWCAAQGACGGTTNNAAGCVDKPTRKWREKCSKAHAALTDMVTRSEHVVDVRAICADFALLLKERAESRRLWEERSADKVFHSVSATNRPLPVPLVYNHAQPPPDAASNDIHGYSPLPGDPASLHQLAHVVIQAGEAYTNKDASLLPPFPFELPMDRTHNQPEDWNGWTTGDFALEMQESWAQLLLHGTKSIETRSYRLPLALLGKRIHILQSPNGTAGMSPLGNIPTTDDLDQLSVPGWCQFSEMIEYRNRHDFDRDAHRHQVHSNSSGYGWKQGHTNVIYGWVVKEYGMYDASNRPQLQGKQPLLVRRLRSLFELRSEPKEPKETIENTKRKRAEGKPTKKKRIKKRHR